MTAVPVAARRGGAVQASLTELDGRRVAWFRLAGGPHRGAIGPVEGEVIERLIRLALEVGVPVVGELATSGADVRRGPGLAPRLGTGGPGPEPRRRARCPSSSRWSGRAWPGPPCCWASPTTW